MEEREGSGREARVGATWWKDARAAAARSARAARWKNARAAAARGASAHVRIASVTHPDAITATLAGHCVEGGSCPPRGRARTSGRAQPVGVLAPSLTGALGTNGITVYAQYVALQSMRNDPLQGALRVRSWHLALRRVERP